MTFIEKKREADKQNKQTAKMFKGLHERTIVSVPTHLGEELPQV